MSDIAELPRSSSASRWHAKRPVIRAAGSDPNPPSAGFRPRPMQVTWETTRACGWKPFPARLAVRSPRQAPSFSTAEAFHLIAEVAAMQVPLLALTGGDPLLRADLFPIIQYASNHSVQTVLTLLPTPNVNAEVFSDLKACGLMRVGFWLHGSTPGLNDRHWGTNGLHRRTLEMIGACHEVQLPVHVNTIVARRNVLDIEPMVELLTRLDVEWWNVFFSVPASREQAAEMLTAAEHEEIFAKLYQAAQRVQFHIKTTEAPHYQRYILQRRMRESRGRLNASDVVGDSPKSVNEGQGFVFINHQGEVYPSRFLPVSAGNITAQSLSEMYSDSELFLSLRDFSRLKGKCGRCPMRTLCGGSRARAYAVTGDIFAPEPCCAYEP